MNKLDGLFGVAAGIYIFLLGTIIMNLTGEAQIITQAFGGWMLGWFMVNIIHGK